MYTPHYVDRIFNATTREHRNIQDHLRTREQLAWGLSCSSEVQQRNIVEKIVDVPTGTQWKLHPCLMFVSLSEKQVGVFTVILAKSSAHKSAPKNSWALCYSFPNWPLVAHGTAKMVSQQPANFFVLFCSTPSSSQGSLLAVYEAPAQCVYEQGFSPCSVFLHPCTLHDVCVL